MATLSDHPDWRYLLRELDHLYRHQSAGGSAAIRSHQRDVRTRLNRIVEGKPAILDAEPAELPVCVHLARAVDNGLRERTAPVVRAIRNVRHLLRWQYGYEKLPRGLKQKYAYTEFLGPDGPVEGETLILGLVLFAPRCTYPAHSHNGITESYVCLSGASSENDAGVYAPGSMIFNPPGQQHRITTGDFEPCLLSYAWVGSKDALRNPMKFSQKKPAR